MLEKSNESNEVMVSICCLTYNHEKYIAKALDSMLMQETDFKYEILIHDDASTDNTQKIIREYEEKYPDIIKPIYQKENQYSKGVRISLTYQYPRILGNYVAFCEGDDFWIRKDKLSKQVEFLQKNSEYSMSVTGSIYVNTSGEKIKDYTYSNLDTDITPEIFIYQGGGVVATNSIVCRSELLKTTPEFYKKCKVGDLPLLIYFSLCGKVKYFKDKYSAYRVGDSSAWTQRVLKSNIDNYINHWENINETYHMLNKYTEEKYNNIIKKVIFRNNINMINKIISEDFRLLNKPKYAYLKRKISKVRLFYYIICFKFPFIRKILRK